MVKKLLIVALCLPMVSQGQFKTKEISIFKNGTGFFIKSGSLKSTNKSAEWNEDLPNPVFGTIWFNSSSNALSGISSYEKEVPESKDAQDMLGILKSNIGRKVDVTTDKGPVTGTIDDVSKGYITIKVGDKYRILYTHHILSVDFTEKPATMYDDKVKKQVIRLDFKNDKASQDLDLMYMQSGIGWTPNYLVQLKGKDKASITLRANVINDAEDFENADLHFVVGVPNFKFKHIFSPLTSGASLTDFLNQLSGYGRGSDVNMFSNVMRQSTGSYQDQESDFDVVGPDFQGLAGASAEDLYFYHLKNVSLKKGGRAFYDVLKADIPVEHVYESYLRQNGNSNYYSQGFSFNQLNHNEVWHSIKLTNNTPFPLTTGSAMVTKLDGGKDKPISQDELQYTPVGGTSYMKITESPDIKMEDIEQESDESGPTKKFSGYEYQLFTVNGSIKLKNFKKEKVKMRIKRRIIGELIKTNIEWQKSRSVRVLSSLNDENDVCWEFMIGAGEEKEISYSYKVWIRR